MGHIDDFLNRLAEHIDAQRQRLNPDQNPLAFLGQAALAPSRMALDTVGLGLEGTAKLGNYAAGEALLGMNAAQDALHNAAPAVFTSPADQAVLAQGPMHPQAALDAARNGDDSATAWLAGLLAMSADPANLIPLPVGHARQAENLAARAARKSASFGGTEAGADFLRFLDTAVPEVADQAMADALAQLRQPQDIEAIFRRADRVKNLPDLTAARAEAQGQYDNALATYRDVQRQKAAAVSDVKADFQTPGGRVSKWSPDQRAVLEADPEVQRLSQQIEALRATPAGIPDQVGTSGKFTTQRDRSLKGMGFQLAAARKKALATAGLPTEGQAADVLDPLIEDAKNAVTIMNPGGPQRGQTFHQFMEPHRANLARVQAESDDAVGAIRNALTSPDQAPITPQQADILLGPGAARVAAGKASRDVVAIQRDIDRIQRGLPEAGDSDRLAALRAEMDDATAGTPNALSQLNEKFNKLPGGPENGTAPLTFPREELDPVTGRPVRTDPAGWFAVPFDPDTIAANPLKAEATAVATPVRAQDGSEPLKEAGHASHLWDLIKYAIGEGWSANRRAAAAPVRRVGFKDVAGVWSGVNIETPKNAIWDYVYNTWLLHNEGINRRYITQQMDLLTDRLKSGDQAQHRLFGNLGDFMEALGLDVEDPHLVENVRKRLGTSFFDLEADSLNKLEEMNLLQTAAVGTGLQLLSPTRAVTGLVTAPLNLLIPMRSKAFHIINNVTHTAARVAAFEDAFLPFLQNSAKDMLARAATEGRDVSLLTGRGFSRAGEELAADGFFTPQEVTRLLGERYGQEWGHAVDAAFQAGFDNSKRVLGDYQLDGALGNAEKFVRKFVPFMSWSWRAYPRTAKYVLDHPAVGLAVAHLVALDRTMAQAENRPAYQVGTIGINKDTPLLGILASAFSPEQEATVRLNPMALFSPVGGEALGAGVDTGQDPENAYQAAARGLGVIGASFNPLIQTAAYVTGADYKAPGNASRYAPVDQALGDATGLQVGSIQQPLRAVRKAVSGKADTYDPVEAKAKELVFERTGLPLEDRRNQRYALEIKNKTGVYRDAEGMVLKGGAVRALVNASGVPPVTVTSRTTEERRAAEAGLPYTYRDIQDAKDQGLTSLAARMENANKRYRLQHPAAAVNQDAVLPKKR